MDSVEASGRTIDDAILQALARLGRRRDEVEVAILQDPVRGNRGIGAREARVRVWLKRPNHVLTGQPNAVLTPDLAQQWLGPEEDEELSAPSQRHLEPQRTPSIFQHEPVTMLREPADDFEEDAADADKSGEPDEKQAVPLTEATINQIVHTGSEVLREILLQMGIPSTIEITSRDPVRFNIRIRSDAATQALLIGRRGETLAALQFLVNMMINRQTKTRYRVVIDIENYRRRRDENLCALALRIATQVTQTQRSMALEPMTPYERRIIHMALQTSPVVKTQSTGEGDQRRVVISLKQR